MSLATSVRRLLVLELRAVQVQPLLGVAGRGALWVAVALVLSRLLRPVFCSFLEQGPAAHTDGLFGLWLRAGLVVLTAASLGVHGRLLHGSARRVLALLPVDPVAVVVSDVVMAGLRAMGFAVMVAIALLPVALEVSAGAWLAGLLLLGGAAWLGAVLAAIVLLGAVRAAEAPGARPYLNLVRGNNPPAQAAIIWALAPSTLFGGWLLAVASAGAAGTLPLTSVGVLPVVAALAALAVPGLARSTWWPAGFVVADIQARYAVLETPEDAGRVWLDGWTTRLPAPVAREAILLLRYGWRQRRGWISGLWLVGLAVVWAGWSEAPDAPARAALVAALGAWWVGLLPIWAAQEERPLLRTWLARADAQRALGAAFAAVAWGLPPLGAALIVVALRQGLVTALLAVAGSLVLVAAAAVASALGTVRPQRGAHGYMVASAVVLGAAAWGVA